MNKGYGWLKENTEIERAFVEIEKERDSWNKFYKAKYFAKHLNDHSKLKRYTHLFEQEQERIK